MQLISRKQSKPTINTFHSISLHGDLHISVGVHSELLKGSGMLSKAFVVFCSSAWQSVEVKFHLVYETETTSYYKEKVEFQPYMIIMIRCMWYMI
jgi:hypothetical protein